MEIISFRKDPYKRKEDRTASSKDVFKFPAPTGPHVEIPPICTPPPVTDFPIEYDNVSHIQIYYNLNITVRNFKLID